ncbi:MAG: ABC transporter substrate-binding protein [Candidimonas sp.]|nr:MAG: ABC transporter substrate-binding protein [Candidimonas sp.]
MSRRQFILTSLAASAMQASPLKALAQQAKVSKQPFRWVPQADLSILDPVFTTAYITQEYGELVFDTLYGLDANYAPHPQMAQGHTKSADGLTWTITLRKGLKFHDGSPVRAQDAVASIERWGQRDPMGMTFMAAVKQISAKDDGTMVIDLHEPFPMVPEALGKPASNIAAIMPERLAKTSASKAITEAVGSGPFRFLPAKRLLGSRVAYERFAGYVPSPLKMAPSFTAGPKIVHVPGVEWHIIPDSATGIAALQAGEVDGVELVDNDFIPLLRGQPDIKLVKRSLPSISIMRFNQLYPPFNNKAMRQAILAVVNQKEYMIAANGSEYPEYWNAHCGVFVPGSPMDSKAGMEALDGPRDFAKAQALIKAAGYHNEPIILLDPVDYPNHHASAQVTAALFKKLKLNVVVQSMDWSTVLQRRNSQAAPASGGWNVAFTAITGTNNLDPAGQLGIRANGKKAWFGWPDDPKLVQLRADWFKAPDLAARKKICEEIQKEAFDFVPYIPLGAIYSITALRSNWQDFQLQMPLFYTLRQA